MSGLRPAPLGGPFAASPGGRTSADSLLGPGGLVGELDLGSEGVVVGAVIMLGTLFGLIVLIFGLVLRFDPEARRAPGREDDR